MGEGKPSYEQLARNEDLYRRAIVQAGAVPYVLEYEPYRHYTFIGEGIEQLTGYKPEEFSADMWAPMILETVMRGEQAGLGVAEASERTRAGEFRQWSCDLRIVTKSGEERWMSDASIEIRAEDGMSTGSIGMLQDITERKRVERRLAMHDLELELLEAQRLESLSVLAGGVAHDFNNLLATIIGYASLALSHLPTGSPVRADVEQIEVAGQRAAELTRQMLAYSGAGQMTMAALDLAAVLREVGGLLEPQQPELVVRYEIEDRIPLVSGDSAQMGQLVLNLLKNAVEAIGDEPGTITLRALAVDLSRQQLDAYDLGQTLAAGRYVLVEVEDSGCGMDEPTRARAFDPFFTTKFTGRGLGLSAVLGIVRGHGGAIRVTSAPGTGATVAIVLPAVTG